jgi:hypothetical protein
MSNPFLNGGGSTITLDSLSNGSAQLNVYDISIQSLASNFPVVTDNDKNLKSSLIAISQVENLQPILDSKIDNPLTVNLDCNNFDIINADSINASNISSDGDMISSNGGFKSKNINVGVVGDLNQITTSSGGLQITPLNNNFINISSTGTGFATLQSVNSGTIVQAGTSLSLFGGTTVGITASGNINMTSSTGKINVSGTSLSPSTDQVMNNGDSSKRWLNVYSNDVKLTSSGSLNNSLSTLNNQVIDWSYPILSYGIRSTWNNGTNGTGGVFISEMSGTNRLYSTGGYTNISSYSDNGGVTWSLSASGLPIQSVASNWNSTGGLALGIAPVGAIYQTVDGGINWTLTGNSIIGWTISTSTLQSILWTGSSYIAIATASPFLWSSSNGIVWSSIATATRAVRQIIQAGNNNIVTIGSSGPMYSSDNGVTFTNSVNSSNMFTCGYNQNNSQLVASHGGATGSSIFYYSLDLGVTWITLATFVPSYLLTASFYLTSHYDRISKKLLFCGVPAQAASTYMICQIDDIVALTSSSGSGKLQGLFLLGLIRGGNVAYSMFSSLAFGVYSIVSFAATNSCFYATLTNDYATAGNITSANKLISLNSFYSVNEFRIQTQINNPPRTSAFTANTPKQININTANTSNSYFSVAPSTGIITYLGPNNGYTYSCSLSWSGTVTSPLLTSQQLSVYFVQNAATQQAKGVGLLPINTIIIESGGSCQCFMSLTIGDTINVFANCSATATISFNSLVVNIRQLYN